MLAVLNVLVIAGMCGTPLVLLAREIVELARNPVRRSEETVPAVVGQAPVEYVASRPVLPLG